MKFYIQTINNKIEHDFSFALIKSIEFLKWKNTKEFISYTLQEDNSAASIKQIPIGTVEFVLDYFKNLGLPAPKPVNVPESLHHSTYSGRYIRNVYVGQDEVTMGDLRRAEQFCKSSDIIKSEHIPTNYNLSDETYLLPGNYQFSTFVDIASEWRCFVYRDELVGLKNYSGDFTVFPDVALIREMIKQHRQYYEDKTPPAYVLDVAVDPNRMSSTFVVEVHDFFSIGFYGFDRYDLIPYMFSNWYFSYVNSCISCLELYKQLEGV